MAQAILPVQPPIKKIFPHVSIHFQCLMSVAMRRDQLEVRSLPGSPGEVILQSALGWEMYVVDLGGYSLSSKAIDMLFAGPSCFKFTCYMASRHSRGINSCQTTTTATCFAPVRLGTRVSGQESACLWPFGRPKGFKRHRNGVNEVNVGGPFNVLSRRTVQDPPAVSHEQFVATTTSSGTVWRAFGYEEDVQTQYRRSAVPCVHAAPRHGGPGEAAARRLGAPAAAAGGCVPGAAAKPAGLRGLTPGGADQRHGGRRRGAVAAPRLEAKPSERWRRS